MKKFTIVVPVYQNKANIPSTAEALIGFCRSMSNYRACILFVDDGSTDGSYEELLIIQKKFPQYVSCLKLTRNFGQTPAIQAGLRYVKADVVGVISCDLQDPYEKFSEMLQLWERGYKYIIGYRRDRPENILHKTLSFCYWSLVRHFSLSDFPAQGYDFCLLDQQLVAEINRINEKNTSIFPLIFWLGYKPYEIEIDRIERKLGRSQWNLYKKIRLTIDTLLGFTRIPIRFITYTSLLCSFFSVLYLFWIVYQRVMTSTPVLGWASIVFLISFFGSLILFSLGIMAEYLSRILEESRGRPSFVVEEVASIESES